MPFPKTMKIKAKATATTPACPAKVTVPEDVISKHVKISNLPRNTEPSTVYAWLFGSEDNIVEIMMERRGASIAWVEFSTEEQAAFAASRCDGANVCSHHRRIQANLVPATIVPAEKRCKLHYRDFTWKQSDDAAQVSSTLRITGLPRTNVEMNVKKMAGELGLDELDEGDDEERHGIKEMSTIPGGLEVEFECEEDAERFHEEYDGRYWKNDTIHIQYC